jgi:hypothetical protein
MKEKVLKYLKKNYTTEDILMNIDEKILDYLEDDWNEEYENEYDWYVDYGRGEAESDVRMELEKELFGEFDTNYEDYLKETGEEIWKTIYILFPELDV